jgi:glycosyltransferase involved in cell wall biosynthesis
LTIGFHAPFPPAATGVADYAEALAGALGRFARIERNPKRAADIELYHIGNNPLHRPIYERALRRPGVVVLHDAVLHHYFLGSLAREAYIEEFVYNYGEWHRGLAARLWERRARSAQDPRYFEYPMLRRIAESALAVVVHNAGAAGLVRTHAPGAHVVEVPHLFVPPELPPASSVLRLRARLGVAPSATLFAVFGYLRESKRLAAVLRAFRKVRRARPDVALLVAGKFASADLERAAAAALAQPGVLRAGYLAGRDFWLHAAAADVGINLRYPAAGETSGIAIRLMGIGKPVILTAGAATAGFPEETCLRVDYGPAEEEMLAASMAWLAEFPEAARAIGRKAAAYVGSTHAIERCAEKYFALVAALARRF